MSDEISYTDAPADMEESLENAAIVNDILPSPEELIRKVSEPSE